jgi:hypothetical protein
MAIAHAHSPNPSTSDCIAVCTGSPTSQITTATNNNIEDYLRPVLFSPSPSNLNENERTKNDQHVSVVGAKF